MNKKENQNPAMSIDLSQTEGVICKECKNETFTQQYQMRKLSALLSPMGQESMIPIQVFVCAKCGHINKGFLPKED